MHATTIAVAAAFAIGIFASWAFIGAAAAVIFALVFIQKLLSGFFDGINDAPMPAFLFGFFGLPFFEGVRWMIKTPALSGGWPPIIPSPDVLVDAIVGAAAGILVIFIPIEWAGLVCVIMKAMMAPIKDSLVYGIPPRPTIVINVLFNIVLFKLLMFIVRL